MRHWEWEFRDALLFWVNENCITKDEGPTLGLTLRRGTCDTFTSATLSSPSRGNVTPNRSSCVAVPFVYDNYKDDDKKMYL